MDFAKKTNLALKAVAACFLSVTAVGASAKTDVLCIYYPEWHAYPEGDRIFGEGKTEWDLVRTAPARFPGHEQPIVPSLGYLDDSKPEDVAKEIDLAADAGIDVFVYDWYWANMKPIQHEALEEGFMKAKNRARMKFALMWAYHERTDAFRPAPGHGEDRHYWKLAHTDGEFLAAFDYCCRTYFKSPEYYLKSGEIFFSLYSANFFVQKHGGSEKTKLLLEAAQLLAKKHGLPRVHFSAMTYTPRMVPELVAAGFASTSMYSMCPWNLRDGLARDKRGEQVHDYAEFIEAHRRVNGDLAKASPMHIPLAVRGWDSTARCRVEEPFPFKTVDYPCMGVIANAKPELFGQIVREMREQAENDPKKPGAILINAWNEYTEGSYLMPDVRNGDAYLRALEKALK